MHYVHAFPALGKPIPAEKGWRTGHFPVCYACSPTANPDLPMIRHTVVFRLKHAAGSAEEKRFLADALCLAAIPGVERFERLRQTSPKNPYRFGFSMEFADPAAYRAYNGHPDHCRFVEERWLPEVAEFMEVDYEPLAEEA